MPTVGYVELNTPIYVPVDVVEEYKNSPWWSTFTNIQAGGICGDLIFWKYNDGVLVVNGIGAMTNYASKDEVPWAPIREDITKVIIGSGITTVGAFAFNGCTNLVDLTLPVDLTSIENNAFEMCTKLKNLDLSDCTELTFIGRFAFKDCNSLTNLALPVSLTNIGYGAFYDCTSLAQISSLATTPPTIEIDDTTPVFGNVDKTIPVYVPVGSVDAHKAADGWKEFTNISEVGSTGNDEMNTADAFVIVGNDVVLNEAQEISIYTVQGSLVYSGYTNRITLQDAGVYILRMANGKAKIVIR